MASAHSKLAPSAAHRWMNCPGSVALIEEAAIVPAPMSSYALDGTAAAWLAAKCIERQVHPKQFKGREVIITKKGRCGFPEQKSLRMAKPIHRWSIGVDEVANLAVYTKFIESLRKKHSECQIETRVVARHLDPVLAGTPDTALWTEDGETIDIVDLKWGQGIVVEAEGNEQLLIYALAFVPNKFNNFRLTIVQPRAIHPQGPIRTWTVSAKQLKAFGKKVLKAIERTKEQEAGLNPGDWCRFCPVNGQCPAQLAQAREVAASEFGAIDKAIPATPVEPRTLTNKQVANVLRHKSALEQWLKAVELTAKERINAGKQIPGFKMVETTGHRKWMDERIAIKNLRRKGFSPEEIFEKSIRSPAQVEKFIPKGGLFKKKTEVQKFVTALCERSRYAALASSDDPRPEYRPALDEFGDLTATSNEEDD